jgi:hypothetical protein
MPTLYDITGWLLPPRRNLDAPFGRLEIWREGDDCFAIILESYHYDNSGPIGHGGCFEEAAENAYLAWRLA